MPHLLLEVLVVVLRAVLQVVLLLEMIKHRIY